MLTIRRVRRQEVKSFCFMARQAPGAVVATRIHVVSKQTLQAAYHRSMTRFFYSAMTTIAIVFALASCVTSTAQQTFVQPGTARLPLPPLHTVILISIDAFKPAYLDRHITPRLQDLVDTGVRAQWMTSSYPALTFPNHWAIVTGLRPDHSGIVHNTMHDDVLGDFKVADTDAVGDGRWWGGEPIWVTAEKAGLPGATMFWPGSQAAIEGIRPTHWRLFDPAVTPASRADTVLTWLNDPVGTRPRIATLYFDEVDDAGHAHGPDSVEVDDTLRAVDAAIGELLDGLARRGLRSTTDLIIVSDHGMTTVLPGHVIAVEDMVGVTEARVISVGQLIGIAANPGHEATVERRLLGAHAHYDCWRKGELPPHWHYGVHPRIPPIVCQMHEGWDALPRTSIAARRDTGTRGSHGYDPALPSMRALFVANGPSFRHGVVIAPFDNIDVYPLLAHLLDIAPAANDGAIAPLLPALRGAGSR